MKLTEYALDNLKRFVTGDNGLTPKQSGSQLVALCNSAGHRDIYSAGLPEDLSRNPYVFDRMKKINGTKNLKGFIEIIFSARHFADSGLSIDIAATEANKIVRPEGYELVKTSEGDYHIASGDPYDEEKTSAIHFEQLETQLIEELKKAKYTIWLAVAWFTNPKVYQVLIEKRNQGLSVQAIILDDEINTRCGLHETPQVHTLKVPPYGPFKNLMHQKFCIVDLKTVIHGSYNWTVKANYNNETLDIETNREHAEKFADQFLHLKLSKTTR